MTARRGRPDRRVPQRLRRRDRASTASSASCSRPSRSGWKSSSTSG
ncbi:MAG: hypothetical protein MZW92_12435 [Comamonadaceae bacterium]|nr:hypothetical protein [Comamonadaceae bacterium]